MGRKPGPKPGYTIELIEKIAEYRALGITRAEIARCLLIPETTIQSWEKMPEFRTLFAERRLEIASKQVNKVLDCSDFGATGAKWWLERQFREGFAPPTQKNETDVKGNLEVSLVMKLPE